MQSNVANFARMNKMVLAYWNLDFTLIVWYSHILVHF